MATCRQCRATEWTPKTDAGGICPACEDAARATVDAHLARVKDALGHLRRGRDPRSLLGRCEEALGWTRELLRHERLRLVPIRPSPSAILPVLEAKRCELLAELRRAEAAPTDASRDPEERPQTSSQADPDSSWWAWLPEERDAPRDARRSARERVHCLVLLEPGGLRATIENVSSGGLLLRAPRVRSPGSVVRLIVSTPGGPLRADGVVRWIAGESDEGVQTPAGMGIEFTRRSPELDAYLRHRFPSLFPPMPGLEESRRACSG